MDPSFDNFDMPEVELMERYALEITGRDGQCYICLKDYDCRENLRLIKNCNHIFHPECLDAWLKTNTTCPVCGACMQVCCIPLDIRYATYADFADAEDVSDGTEEEEAEADLAANEELEHLEQSSSSKPMAHEIVMSSSNPIGVINEMASAVVATATAAYNEVLENLEQSSSPREESEDEMSSSNIIDFIVEIASIVLVVGAANEELEHLEPISSSREKSEDEMSSPNPTDIIADISARESQFHEDIGDNTVVNHSSENSSTAIAAEPDEEANVAAAANEELEHLEPSSSSREESEDEMSFSNIIDIKVEIDSVTVVLGEANEELEHLEPSSSLKDESEDEMSSPNHTDMVPVMSEAERRYREDFSNLIRFYLRQSFRGIQIRLPSSDTYIYIIHKGENEVEEPDNP